MLQNAIVEMLEFEFGKGWVQIRRELTDEKSGKVYNLYEGLWPLETDLLALLPKPDGEARAIYTGSSTRRRSRTSPWRLPCTSAS
jgi:hypothetical protein